LKIKGIGGNVYANSGTCDLIR